MENDELVLINPRARKMPNMVYVAGIAVKGQEKNRKLQATLTIFAELQIKEIRNARRYVYEYVPEDIRDLADSELQEHLINVEEAIIAFERVGYLLQEGHIDTEPIISNYWAEVWKCWQRTRGLIHWAREKRGDPTYLGSFDHLFFLAEAYRIENNYGEPRFY